MMFTRRQKTLIMELLRTNDFMTSHQLAISAGISIRTVKGEIKTINEMLQIYDICIEAKTGLGYRINTMGNKAIPDINYLLEDMDYENFIHVTDSMEERIHYIACRLLEADDYIKSAELADALYISTSTLSHDLKQVKYIFQIYGLKILSKPYKGIYIAGKEKHIRNCIDYLCFKNNSGNDFSYVIYGDTAVDKIEALFAVLKELAEKYQYPSYNLHDIAIQTYIAIKRIQQGKEVKDEVYQSSKTAYDISNAFFHYIETQESITIPDSEKCRLRCIIDTLYVIEDEKDIAQEYKWLLEETFQEISMTYHFDFKQDFTLTNSLLQHIRQLIKRCQNDVLIWNPLSNRILCDYLLSVDFANVLARKLEVKYGFKISIHEFSYLVLYFNVTIYSSSHMKDKSLYIYCPGSRAEEQLICEEVKRLFKEIVANIKITTKEELETMHYSGLDIMITNKELPPAVPTYIQTVYADLNHKMEFIFNILLQLNEQVSGYFNIRELLNENMFYVNQNITGIDEYFEFLFDSLCDSMVMDYGEAGRLYEQIETFGQEVGNHIVLIRSQNQFVMPFIHITTIKDMFYWHTGYVKLIIFINFGDSHVEFRDFVYERLKTMIINHETPDKIWKTMDFNMFVDTLNHQ